MNQCIKCVLGVLMLSPVVGRTDEYDDLLSAFEQKFRATIAVHTLWGVNAWEDRCRSSWSIEKKLPLYYVNGNTVMKYDQAGRLVAIESLDGCEAASWFEKQSKAISEKMKLAKEEAEAKTAAKIRENVALFVSRHFGFAFGDDASKLGATKVRRPLSGGVYTLKAAMPIKELNMVDVFCARRTDRISRAEFYFEVDDDISMVAITNKMSVLLCELSKEIGLPDGFFEKKEWERDRLAGGIEFRIPGDSCPLFYFMRERGKKRGAISIGDNRVEEKVRKEAFEQGGGFHGSVGQRNYIKRSDRVVEGNAGDGLRELQ